MDFGFAGYAGERSRGGRRWPAADSAQGGAAGKPFKRAREIPSSGGAIGALPFASPQRCQTPGPPAPPGASRQSIRVTGTGADALTAMPV